MGVEKVSGHMVPSPRLHAVAAFVRFTCMERKWNYLCIQEGDHFKIHPGADLTQGSVGAPSYHRQKGHTPRPGVCPSSGTTHASAGLPACRLTAYGSSKLSSSKGTCPDPISSSSGMEPGQLKSSEGMSPYE